MRTRRLVVDASAVLAMLLPEVHTQEAREALSQAERLLAPDLLICEVVSALRARVARNEILPQEAHVKRLEARDLPADFVSARSLDEQALSLAMRLSHSAYDCFYLALAIEEDTQLVTGDKALAQAAHSAGMGSYVQLLGGSAI